MAERQFPTALVGGLLAIIGLIAFEVYTKKTTPAAPIITGAAANASTGAPITSATANPSPSASPNTATLLLPQFSSALNADVIDTSVTPAFSGQAWTCPNGDIPYYDPAAGAVFCVLPGFTPQSGTMALPQTQPSNAQVNSDATSDTWLDELWDAL